MTGARVFFGVALLLNLILTVFVVAELRRLARRVDDIGEALPQRHHVAMLRPLRIRETLERNCTSCHTDRQFSSAYGRSHSELEEMVWRMKDHPGGDVVPADEVELVEAALITVRCTSCHGEERVGELALMTREQRNAYLMTKVRRVRPVFRTDEYHDLVFAFDVLLDAPRRRSPSSR